MLPIDWVSMGSMCNLHFYLVGFEFELGEVNLQHREYHERENTDIR